MNISSVYDFLSELVGHVWQYAGGTQYNQFQEQPYLYVASLILIIFIGVVTVDFFFKAVSAIFNFRL